MVKLTALYKKPDDPDAFMRHYEEVHMPLVKRTPGLKKIVVNRVTANLTGGPSPYFMIAEMHYPNQETFTAAMESVENRAAGEDLMGFAKGLVTLLVLDETDVYSDMPLR